MRELDPIRRLAPPVEPLAPGELARIRARALAPPRRRIRVPGLLAPAAVAVAVVALVVVLGGGRDREVPAQAPAAGAGFAGSAVPRLLLDGGWTVTRVDEWKRGSGEMTFSRDDRTLELSWLPTRVAGPKPGPAKEPGARPELEFGTAGGERAAVWSAEDAGDRVAIWRDGGTTLLARAPALSATELAGLVQRLREVGVEEWRRAVPERGVTPPEHAGAVEGMLAGLPLPPGLDVEALAAGATTRDRYQLGAQVAGAVVCRWIAEWAEAKEAGDGARMRRAADALATSRGWPVLRDMNAEGAYPEVVWQYADAVAGDGTVVAGKVLSVEKSYKAALCS